MAIDRDDEEKLRLPTTQVTSESRATGEADASKDFHALLGGIFGAENIRMNRGMRRVEGEEHPQTITTLQIDDAAFDELPITLEQFIRKLNAFGPQEGTPLALASYIEGIPFALVIDADAAQGVLDKQQESPDGDRLMPQQASLRGFLEVLAVQKEHVRSGAVSSITSFTR